MTVHHLSAPDKSGLVAQIAAITEKAGEAGHNVNIQIDPPVGREYRATVIVKDGKP